MSEGTAAAAAAPSATIQEGDYAIFDEHGEKKSIHQIRANGHAKVGKFHIPLGQLVGAPWGSSYRLAADGSHLIPITQHEPVLPPPLEKAGCDGDNSTLVDRNQANQQLTAADIDSMRASGKTGDEILAALCSNSTTFDTKTEFAQAKYKTKKARKYNTVLSLLRPNSWHICQVSFDKAPSGVWNLRPDSLALLLSLANVAAHSRTLLLENCQGLLAAACAERQGGHGVLCCLGTGGKTAPLTGLRLLNLDQQHKGIVVTAQLPELTAAHQRVKAEQEAAAAAATAAAAAENGNGQPATDAEQQDAPHQPGKPAAAAATEAQGGGSCAAAAAAAATSSPVRAVPVVAAMEVDEPSADAAAAAAEPDEQQPSKKRRQDKPPAGQQQQDDGQEPASAAAAEQEAPGAEQAAAAGDAAADDAAAGAADGEADGASAGGWSGRRYAARAEELDRLMRDGGFTSAIIAAPRLHPSAALSEVLPLLAPSSPFVVFSPWLQPLAEAHQQLTSSRQAVLLQLQETWLRPYQVLPGRTHPHMNMTTGGTGGYVLSGISVARGEQGGGGASGGTAGETGQQQQQQESRSAGKGRGGRGSGRGRGRGGRKR